MVMDERDEPAATSPHTTTAGMALPSQPFSQQHQQQQPAESIVMSSAAASTTQPADSSLHASNGFTYREERSPREVDAKHESQENMSVGNAANNPAQLKNSLPGILGLPVMLPNGSPATTSCFTAHTAYQNMAAMYSASQSCSPTKTTDNTMQFAKSGDVQTPLVTSSSSEDKVMMSVTPTPRANGEQEAFAATHQALMSLNETHQLPSGYHTFTTEKKNGNIVTSDGTTGSNGLENNNSIVKPSHSQAPINGNKQDASTDCAPSVPIYSGSYNNDQPSAEVQKPVNPVSEAPMTLKDALLKSDEFVKYSVSRGSSPNRETPMDVDKGKNELHESYKMGRKSEALVSTEKKAQGSMVQNGTFFPGLLFPGIPGPMPYPNVTFDPNMMAANYAMMQSYMSTYAPLQKQELVKAAIAPPAPPKQLTPKAPSAPSSLISSSPKATSPAPAKHLPKSLKPTSLPKGNLKDLRTYKCKVCPRIFTHLTKLVRHESTHLHESPFRCGMFVKSTSKPFACLLCSQKFADQATLEIHIADTHKKTSIGSSHALAHEPTKQDPKAECYRCRYCPKKFSQTSLLILHEQEHLQLDGRRALVGLEAQVTAQKEVPVRRTEPPKEKPNYSCKTCGKGFDSSYMLERHKYLENCSKTSVSENQYPLQQRLEQSVTEQEFACPICRKKYKCEKLLKSHVKFSHLEERPHVCSICSKAFKQKATLKQHEKLHSEEKPYICHICSRGFVYPSRLKTHQQTCKPGEPAL